MYHFPVLKLLAAPVTNDRGPRYMERALAAIHQSHRIEEAIVFRYGTSSGRVGLFLQCADAVNEVVTGPVAANYPNCTLAAVENLDQPPLECDRCNGRTLALAGADRVA
jgi:hypothetical protein